MISNLKVLPRRDFFLLVLNPWNLAPDYINQLSQIILDQRNIKGKVPNINAVITPINGRVSICMPQPNTAANTITIPDVMA